MPEGALPEAGLYRTIFPHPSEEQAVGARRLVYFAPSSDQGPPAVLVPDTRDGRVWRFGRKGVKADDKAWLASLVPLPTQGYYELTRRLIYGVGQHLPERLLVFLSYDEHANAVVYPGVGLNDQSIQFGTDPIAISDLQLDGLRAVSFGLAQARPAPSTVH